MLVLQNPLTRIVLVFLLLLFVEMALQFSKSSYHLLGSLYQEIHVTLLFFIYKLLEIIFQCISMIFCWSIQVFCS